MDYFVDLDTESCTPKSLRIELLTHLSKSSELTSSNSWSTLFGRDWLDRLHFIPSDFLNRAHVLYLGGSHTITDLNSIFDTIALELLGFSEEFLSEISPSIGSRKRLHKDGIAAVLAISCSPLKFYTSFQLFEKIFVCDTTIDAIRAVDQWRFHFISPAAISNSPFAPALLQSAISSPNITKVIDISAVSKISMSLSDLVPQKHPAYYVSEIMEAIEKLLQKLCETGRDADVEMEIHWDMVMQGFDADALPVDEKFVSKTILPNPEVWELSAVEQSDDIFEDASNDVVAFGTSDDDDEGEILADSILKRARRRHGKGSVDLHGEDAVTILLEKFELMYSLLSALHSLLPLSKVDVDSGSMEQTGRWLANAGFRIFPVIGTLLTSFSFRLITEELLGRCRLLNRNEVTSIVLDPLDLKVLKFVEYLGVPLTAGYNSLCQSICSLQLRLIHSVVQLVKRLSVNNDNKVLMFQTQDGVIPHALLTWLAFTNHEDYLFSNEELTSNNVAKQKNPIDRLNCICQDMRRNAALTLWNVSKDPTNTPRLITNQQSFSMLVKVATNKRESDRVLRRVLICLQNLPRARFWSDKLVEQFSQVIASEDDNDKSAATRPVHQSVGSAKDAAASGLFKGGAVSPMSKGIAACLSSLFSILIDRERLAFHRDEGNFESKGKKEAMTLSRGTEDEHGFQLRIIGTFANLAYLGVLDKGKTHAEAVILGFRRFIKFSGSGFETGQSSKSVGDFSLIGSLMTQLNRKTILSLMPSVRFEIAKLCWCMLRSYKYPLSGADENRLEWIIYHLDVVCSSIGIAYDDVPRVDIDNDEVKDLLSLLSEDVSVLESKSDTGGMMLSGMVVPSSAPATTIVQQLFAAWILAHCSQSRSDCETIVSNGGIESLSLVCAALAEKLRKLSTESCVRNFGKVHQASKTQESIETVGPKIRSLIASLKLCLHTLGNLLYRSSSSLATDVGQVPIICMKGVHSRLSSIKKNDAVVSRWMARFTDPNVETASWFPFENEIYDQCGYRFVVSASSKAGDSKVSGMYPNFISISMELGRIFQSFCRHQKTIKRVIQQRALAAFVNLACDDCLSIEICLESLMRLSPTDVFADHVFSDVRSLVHDVLNNDLLALDFVAAKTSHSNSGNSPSKNGDLIGLPLVLMEELTSGAKSRAIAGQAVKIETPGIDAIGDFEDRDSIALNAADADIIQSGLGSHGGSVDPMIRAARQFREYIVSLNFLGYLLTCATDVSRVSSSELGLVADSISRAVNVDHIKDMSHFAARKEQQGPSGPAIGARLSVTHSNTGTPEISQASIVPDLQQLSNQSQFQYSITGLCFPFFEAFSGVSRSNGETSLEISGNVLDQLNEGDESDDTDEKLSLAGLKAERDESKSEMSDTKYMAGETEDLLLSPVFKNFVKISDSVIYLKDRLKLLNAESEGGVLSSESDSNRKRISMTVTIFSQFQNLFLRTCAALIDTLRRVTNSPAMDVSPLDFCISAHNCDAIVSHTHEETLGVIHIDALRRVVVICNMFFSNTTSELLDLSIEKKKSLDSTVDLVLMCFRCITSVVEFVDRPDISKATMAASSEAASTARTAARADRDKGTRLVKRDSSGSVDPLSPLRKGKGSFKFKGNSSKQTVSSNELDDSSSRKLSRPSMMTMVKTGAYASRSSRLMLNVVAKKPEETEDGTAARPKRSASEVKVNSETSESASNIKSSLVFLLRDLFNPRHGSFPLMLKILIQAGLQTLSVNFFDSILPIMLRFVETRFASSSFIATGSSEYAFRDVPPEFLDVALHVSLQSISLVTELLKRQATRASSNFDTLRQSSLSLDVSCIEDESMNRYRMDQSVSICLRTVSNLLKLPNIRKFIPLLTSYSASIVDCLVYPIPSTSASRCIKARSVKEDYSTTVGNLNSTPDSRKFSAKLKSRASLDDEGSKIGKRSIGRSTMSSSVETEANTFHSKADNNVVLQAFQSSAAAREIRILAATIVGDLSQEIGLIRSLIFPSTITENLQASKNRSRGSLPRASSTVAVDSSGEMSQGSQRRAGWQGCIAFLWMMLRFGDISERSVSLRILNRITKNNNIAKELIARFNDTKTLIEAGRMFVSQNSELQEDLVSLLHEMSKILQLRSQLRSDGGLLLLLQMKRSPNYHVSNSAEQALRQFGDSVLDIHVHGLYCSVRKVASVLISRNVGEGGSKGAVWNRLSVGIALLRPIRNIQLQEAMGGLLQSASNVELAMTLLTQPLKNYGLLEAEAASDLSGILCDPTNNDEKDPFNWKGTFDKASLTAPQIMALNVDKWTVVDLLMLVFHVRDGPIQILLLRLVKTLLSNTRDRFLSSVSENIQIQILNNLIWMLQPLSVRAAFVLGHASKRFKSSISFLSASTTDRLVKKQDSLTDIPSGLEDRQRSSILSLPDDLPSLRNAPSEIAMQYVAGTTPTSRTKKNEDFSFESHRVSEVSKESLSSEDLICAAYRVAFIADSSLLVSTRLAAECLEIFSKMSINFAAAAVVKGIYSVVYERLRGADLWDLMIIGASKSSMEYWQRSSVPGLDKEPGEAEASGQNDSNESVKGFSINPEARTLNKVYGSVVLLQCQLIRTATKIYAAALDASQRAQSVTGLIGIVSLLHTFHFSTFLKQEVMSFMATVEREPIIVPPSFWNMDNVISWICCIGFHKHYESLKAFLDDYVLRLSGKESADESKRFSSAKQDKFYRVVQKLIAEQIKGSDTNVEVAGASSTGLADSMSSIPSDVSKNVTVGFALLKIRSEDLTTHCTTASSLHAAERSGFISAIRGLQMFSFATETNSTKIFPFCLLAGIDADKMAKGQATGDQKTTATVTKRPAQISQVSAGKSMSLFGSSGNIFPAIESLLSSLKSNNSTATSSEFLLKSRDEYQFIVKEIISHFKLKELKFRSPNFREIPQMNQYVPEVSSGELLMKDPSIILESVIHQYAELAELGDASFDSSNTPTQTNMSQIVSGWDLWWGCYYNDGWCFEVVNGSDMSQSLTSRVYRYEIAAATPFSSASRVIAGVPPPLHGDLVRDIQNLTSRKTSFDESTSFDCFSKIELAEPSLSKETLHMAIVEGRPLTSTVRRQGSGFRSIIRQRGFDYDVYNGSLIHLVLCEKVRQVLVNANRVDDFTLKMSCPSLRLRFWRVEAIDHRRSNMSVLIEPSSTFGTREMTDPDQVTSSVLEIIKDPDGLCHLFVLDVIDLSHVADTFGRSALIRAVLKRNISLVERLLGDPTVDVRHSDKQGRTALLHAIIIRDDNLALMLLNHLTEKVRTLQQQLAALSTTSSDSNDRSSSSTVDLHSYSDKREDYLDISISPAASACIVEIKSFVTAIDAQDELGQTALHHSVADHEERLGIVKALVAAKADVNLRDNKGNTPLHLACFYGHVNPVTVLLNHNAGVTVTNNLTQMPLHIACMKSHIKIVSILLAENSANTIRAGDIDGVTPLHFAVRSSSKSSQNANSGGAIGMMTQSTSDQPSGLNVRDGGSEEVIQLLLKHGADLHDLDKESRSPVDFHTYYYQNYPLIREAIVDFSEFQRAGLEHFLIIHFLYYPCHSLNYLGFNLYRGSRDFRKKTTKRFKRIRDNAAQSAKLFSSPRIQESVHFVWKKSGCRKDAVFVLIFFLLYLFIFTLSTVYNSGQGRRLGYLLTKGIEESILRSPFSTAESPNLNFYDIETTDDFWAFMTGPFVSSIHSGESVEWFDGNQYSTGDANEWYINKFSKILGKVRLSQFRTIEGTCDIPAEMKTSVDVCFSEYCDTSYSFCSSVNDDRSYGPNNEFHFKEDVHHFKVFGEVATYDTGCYAELISQNSTQALIELQSLRDRNWVDAGTRAIVLEMSIYAASANKFSRVKLLFEIPAEGTIILPTQEIYTFHGQFARFQDRVVTSSAADDVIRVLSDSFLLLFVFIYFFIEVEEVKELGPFYFISFFNFVDWLLITLHLVSYLIRLAWVVELGNLSSVGDNEFFDMTYVADLVQYEHLIVATALIFAYFKILEPIRKIIVEFYMLVKMLVLMMGRLLKSFAPLLIIVFMAWIFGRYYLLCQIEPKYQTLAHTFALHFPEIFGEISLSDIVSSSIHKNWRFGATILFVVVVVIIMMNMLISLLNELYHELKMKARADWCREQSQQLLTFHSRTQSRLEGGFLFHFSWGGFLASWSAITAEDEPGKIEKQIDARRKLERQATMLREDVDSSLSKSTAPNSSPEQLESTRNSHISILDNNKSEEVDWKSRIPLISLPYGSAETVLQRIHDKTSKLADQYFPDERATASVRDLLNGLNDWSNITEGLMVSPLRPLRLLLDMIEHASTEERDDLMDQGVLRVICHVIEKIYSHNYPPPSNNDNETPDQQSIWAKRGMDVIEALNIKRKIFGNSYQKSATGQAGEAEAWIISQSVALRIAFILSSVPALSANAELPDIEETFSGVSQQSVRLLIWYEDFMLVWGGVKLFTILKSFIGKGFVDRKLQDISDNISPLEIVCSRVINGSQQGWDLIGRAFFDFETRKVQIIQDKLDALLVAENLLDIKYKMQATYSAVGIGVEQRMTGAIFAGDASPSFWDSSYGNSNASPKDYFDSRPVVSLTTSFRKRRTLSMSERSFLREDDAKEYGSLRNQLLKDKQALRQLILLFGHRLEEILIEIACVQIAKQPDVCRNLSEVSSRLVAEYCMKEFATQLHLVVSDINKAKDDALATPLTLTETVDSDPSRLSSVPATGSDVIQFYPASYKKLHFFMEFVNILFDVLSRACTTDQTGKLAVGILREYEVRLADVTEGGFDDEIREGFNSESSKISMSPIRQIIDVLRCAISLRRSMQVQTTAGLNNSTTLVANRLMRSVLYLIAHCTRHSVIIPVGAVVKKVMTFDNSSRSKNKRKSIFDTTIGMSLHDNAPEEQAKTINKKRQDEDDLNKLLAKKKASPKTSVSQKESVTDVSGNNEVNLFIDRPVLALASATRIADFLLEALLYEISDLCRLSRIQSNQLSGNMSDYSSVVSSKAAMRIWEMSLLRHHSRVNAVSTTSDKLSEYILETVVEIIGNLLSGWRNIGTNRNASQYTDTDEDFHPIKRRIRSNARGYECLKGLLDGSLLRRVQLQSLDINPTEWMSDLVSTPVPQTERKSKWVDGKHDSTHDIEFGDIEISNVMGQKQQKKSQPKEDRKSETKSQPKEAASPKTNQRKVVRIAEAEDDRFASL